MYGFPNGPSDAHKAKDKTSSEDSARGRTSYKPWDKDLPAKSPLLYRQGPGTDAPLCARRMDDPEGELGTTFEGA
jgi:hypothetical protein